MIHTGLHTLGILHRSRIHKLFLTAYLLLNIFTEAIIYLFFWFHYTRLFKGFPLGQGFSTSQRSNWHFGPDNSLLGAGGMEACPVQR